jgi:hypothetical protein
MNKTMTTTTTPDLTALDEQIAAAEAAVDAAQNRYRSRPRHGMSLGQRQVRIDREARAHMLDLGLEVDDAVIRLEELKKQRAELVLAELTDAEAVAAEDAAVETAQRELEKAEAAATAARTAYQSARGAQKHRADRIRSQREDLANAQVAINSARSLREREATERSTLVVA